MKIYYLDDESALCEIFREYVEDEKTLVETFNHSDDLISRAQLHRPDLVVLDYRLADASGDEVAERLERSIPKILVTGELDVPVNDVFSAVIKKPYRFAELRKIIESFRAT